MVKKAEKTSLDKVMIIIGYIAVAVIIIYLIGLIVSPSEESRVRNLIKDKYEILSVGMFEEWLGNSSLAYVDMISFGQREDQVFEGLVALTIVYENISEYSVTIHEETQQCNYDMSREDYNSWKNGDFFIDDFIKGVEICY